MNVLVYVVVVVGVAAALQVFVIIVVEVLQLHYEFFYYCGSIAAAFRICLSVKVSGIVHSKR